MCMDCSRNIRHFGHIYGEIEEHKEGKGHRFFYGASRKKRKADTFQIVTKGKGKRKGSSSKSGEESESEDE